MVSEGSAWLIKRSSWTNYCLTDRFNARRWKLRMMPMSSWFVSLPINPLTELKKRLFFLFFLRLQWRSKERLSSFKVIVNCFYWMIWKQSSGFPVLKMERVYITNAWNFIFLIIFIWLYISDVWMWTLDNVRIIK